MKKILLIQFVILLFFSVNTFAIERANVVISNIKINENINTPDSCDVIMLESGDVIEGKIIEINQKEIKYKACNNLNGPLIVIDKSDVFKTIYSNGVNEIVNTKKSSKKEFEPWTAIGFGAGIVGLFFAGIPMGICAVIGSIYGIYNADKEKKRGALLGFLGFLIGLFDIIATYSYLKNNM